MHKNNLRGNSQFKSTPAVVKCMDIKDGQFPGEVIVTIESTKGTLTGIFPASAVNITDRTVDASIIDEKGDLYLVDLPTYTFTSGSKAWFPKSNVRFAGGV